MNITKLLFTFALAVFSMNAGARPSCVIGESTPTGLDVCSYALDEDTLDVYTSRNLQEVSVTSRRGTKNLAGVGIGTEISKSELFRAACCNLGESFTTNPSVDVNYSDAATGARQIKLLGLSGTYVQMLTENIPNFRGAALPFALGYVPGTWMKSIQVSKGASSVRNGFEGITGQINVQYLQPEDEQGVTVNLYGDNEARFEANADGNIHLNERLSTEVLLHYEDRYKEHDANNDGFMDMPDKRQYNIQNRWAYLGNTYIFHGGMSLLSEKSNGGQTNHGGHAVIDPTYGLYRIGINTNRYELYMKHAFVLNKEQGTNLALMATGSLHDMDAQYGLRHYDVDEKNLYAQLMFETNFTKKHNLSTGLSWNHDNLDQNHSNLIDFLSDRSLYNLKEKESVSGAYAQYTYNLNDKFIAMAGLRYDYSNVHGGFVTPRMHVKWMPGDIVTLRTEIGKGYRSAHILAENNFLNASSRGIIDTHTKMEEAWNYGFSAGFNIPVGNKYIKVNAEYYYTDFKNQAVIDLDADPGKVLIYDSNGEKSYSHVFQIDANYKVFRGFDVTAAYRRNIVKATYSGQLMTKPLTNDYKGLISIGYKTPLELWQFDVTLQLNGGGRMPSATGIKAQNGEKRWEETFGAYEQLSAQVTRWFRHFSVYIGGENLTGFKQKNPIVGADTPFGMFDSTMVWGPISGAMVYAGIRINFGRL